MKATPTKRRPADMGESEAKKNWRKENTIMVHARLQKKTDADIIEYLQGRQAQTEIKRALRLLIEIEKQK